MDNAIIQALRRAKQAYITNVGEPTAQLVGGGVRGYLGLDAPEYADSRGMEAYRNAQALGNAPGVGAPAGAFKAAAKVVPETAMFIGALAKTWDKASNAKAVEMEKAGADAREIWRETGNLRGADGKWRQEISDDASKLIENKTATEYISGVGPAEYPLGPIKSALEHSAMSSAYPDVMDIKARLKKGSSGAYIPNTGFGEGFDIPSMNTQSVALHELQHAIQQREKFAQGSGAGEKNYRRLAGEAEARATEARMNMTPAERRAKFPYDSYDVPVDQLIIRDAIVNALRKK